MKTYRVKTIENLAKKVGKERFLKMAGYFSCHVRPTVSDTIYEMTSRWYNFSDRVLESDKLLDEYNTGRFD